LPCQPFACRSTSANDDDDDLSKADAEIEAAVETEADAEALPAAQRRPETPAVLANDAVEDTESEEAEVSSYSQKKNSPPPPEIVFVVVRCFAPCAFAV